MASHKTPETPSMVCPGSIHPKKTERIQYHIKSLGKIFISGKVLIPSRISPEPPQEFIAPAFQTPGRVTWRRHLV